MKKIFLAIICAGAFSIAMTNCGNSNTNCECDECCDTVCIDSMTLEDDSMSIEIETLDSLVEDSII